jgi:hypothetical protein
VGDAPLIQSSVGPGLVLDCPVVPRVREALGAEVEWLDAAARRLGRGLGEHTGQGMGVAEAPYPGVGAEVMVEGTILLDPDDDVLDLVKLAPCTRRRPAEGRRGVVTFSDQVGSQGFDIYWGPQITLPLPIAMGHLNTAGVNCWLSDRGIPDCQR